MALTYTPKGELGSSMPSFELPDLKGSIWNSNQIDQAPAKVIMFICGHCPYVQAIEERLVQLGKDLNAKGIPVVGICSNDGDEYPEDSPEALLKRSEELNYSFPYLIDATQEVAKNFDAVCTPDFFVYDKENRLAYRGRLDDSWKEPSKVKTEELKTATLGIAKGENLTTEQIPSMGCSIKWK